MRKTLLCFAVLAAFSTTVSAHAQEAAPPVLSPAPASLPIAVTLNGSPVTFATGQPIQSGGAVLVPLRGVFEALGASVKFDAATKMINAVRGEQTIALRLGDTAGQVSGKTVALSAPAQMMNGATLVPLRFVAEAFGAQVKWDAQARAVLITTGAQQADKLPPPPGGDTPVLGVISGVFPEDSSLTVRIAGGQNTRLPLASDVTVLARKGDEAGIVAPLLSLQVGDQVTVKRNARGQGLVVEVVYDERKGIIKSIENLPNGNHFVTLTDGTTIAMTKGAPAQMNTNRVAYEDIKPGESVVIRVNPNTGEGIGLAVATANNPAPIPPAKVEITRVTQSAVGTTLKENETVTVTAQGTPGAVGTFTISSVPNAFNLPMKEDPAGTYVGTFTVSGGVTVAKAEVLVTLTLGANVSPTGKAPDTLSIDSAAPVIAPPAPAENTTGADLRPYFSGTFADAPEGVGVDEKSVRLLVNGQDVSDKANITSGLFSYRPAQDLPAGRTTAQIVVRDKAGNESRQEWAFTLAPVVNPIKVVTISPEGGPLHFGDTLQVRMEATPTGQAQFSLGTILTNRSMNESSPGVYEGVYAPRKGDNVSGAKVVVTFIPSDLASGQAPWTRAASATVSIAAGGPVAPVIDRPSEGASVGINRINVSGHAQPGSTVRLTLRYDGKIIALIPVSGVKSDGFLTVQADETTGEWKVNDVALDAPRNASGLKFTIEAVAVAPNGEISAPSIVRFRR